MVSILIFRFADEGVHESLWEGTRDNTSTEANQEKEARAEFMGAQFMREPARTGSFEMFPVVAPCFVALTLRCALRAEHAEQSTTARERCQPLQRDFTLLKRILPGDRERFQFGG